jgi:UDP-glucose 4-epimerase
VEALLARGERVRVLDNLSSGRIENLSGAAAGGRLEFTAGSVCDPALVATLMKGCSRVFHLAASVGVGMVTARSLECLRNNVEGVQSLLAAIHQQPRPPRAVLFSSSEVYGKSERIPLREDADLVLGPSDIPRWSYASGKVLGEFLALAEYRTSGLPVTLVRCFNTCGPRQRSTYGMVVPRLIDQAMEGEPLTVFGDGRQTRCFSFVGDVVQGVLRLSEHPQAVGEIYNLGSDRETSLLHLADRVLAVTGSRSPVRLVPYSEVYGDDFEDVRRRVPDMTKTQTLIGELPGTDLDTLLRLTLASRWRAGTRIREPETASVGPASQGS